MRMSAYLFLILLVLIGVIAQNQSIIIASSALLIIKALGFGDQLFPTLASKGINWGVTIITIAVLVPIATGDIGFKELWNSIRGPVGIVAFGSGIFVALAAAQGVQLMRVDPVVTTALLAGTILAVGFMKGVPVGPLIGAGIAALILGGYQVIEKWF
ncbi:MULTISPECIES: DUF441 domain-containing protein [Exiguobacterium]|uniref:DUF441 domain-containing protein n=2 Tax=Bacillales Family XII. Incertae Sedis TaxID=539742 RepID=UPI001CD6F40A|nr:MULTISPECIES: DUF441 domain-containing protein [Exiguobacterium]MCA0980728.1 DUF441 domain-containing protein [Exiguobacterium aestuarii]